MRAGLRTKRWTSAVAGLAVSALVLAACGGGKEEKKAGGPTTVHVVLQEWGVTPTPASAPAGTITFQAENKGPEDEHELVVIKTDLAAFQLPVTAQGAVDEKGAGIQVIGEIEELAVGKSESKSFELSPGKYVLICNVVHEHPEVEAHYKQGMRAAFTVR